MDEAEEEDLDLRLVLESCHAAARVIEDCCGSYRTALEASLAPARKEAMSKKKQLEQQHRASSIRAMMAMKGKAPSMAAFRSPPPVPAAILEAATPSPPPPSASTLAAVQARSMMPMRERPRPPPPPPDVLRKLRATGAM